MTAAAVPTLTCTLTSVLGLRVASADTSAERAEVAPASRRRSSSGSSIKKRISILSDSVFDGRARIAAWGAAGIVVFGHISGLFYGAEHDAGPLAHLADVSSFDWLRIGESTISVGSDQFHATLEQLNRGDDDDKALESATCGAMNEFQDQSGTTDEWKDRIDGQIYSLAQDDGFVAAAAEYAVRKQENDLANILATQSESPTFGHFYRQVCFGIG